MNLINADIKPDPFDPQTGDVYEYGAPFVQRLVVEDAPTREDPRVRYRIDGGVDSNLTSVAQFHRHLAGLTGLRGVGRVREYPPITAEVRRSLVHQLRSTALGVDPVTGDLMRGAATTIVEQAAALGRLALLQEAVAQALAEDIPDIDDAAATAGLAERLGLLIAALPEVYRAREEAEARAVELERSSSLMVTRDALCATLGAVSLGSLRVPTAAVHLLDSLASVYGDHTAIPLAELIDAAFAFGICASRHPELPQIKCPGSHGAQPPGIGCLDAACNKAAMINLLCPPGWRVGMEGSGVAVFQPGETVPMTIMGDSEARVVAEIWRWHMQPVERRLAEFQNGLAGILGWPVPQLHDPSGASDILTEVRVRFGTKTPWRHDHFKAIADDLRLAASLEDSGSCNNVRSAEAMRTAAATIMELAAMLRSIDETLRSSLPDKGEASTLELLTSLVAEKQRAVPSHATAEALDPRQHQVKFLREQIANLETALRACEADFDAIRSAYLDVNGTTGTLVEIVGSIRGSCEMQARVMNLKDLLTERESDIKKLADMLKDVLGRIGTEDAK